MNIIGALAAQLKLEPEAATGLAGALLLLVEDLVLERVDYATAGRMRTAVPEVTFWQSSAPTIAQGFSLDALPAAAGPTDQGQLEAVLTRNGLDANAAPVAMKLIGEFLTARLDGALLATVKQAVPLLP